MKTLSKKDIDALRELFFDRIFWIRDSGFVIELNHEKESMVITKARKKFLDNNNYSYQSYYRYGTYRTKYIITKNQPSTPIRKFIYKILTNCAEALINLRCNL